MVRSSPELATHLPPGPGRVLALGPAAVTALRDVGCARGRIHRVGLLERATVALERNPYDAVVVDEARLAADREADLAVLEFHRADAPLFLVHGGRKPPPPAEPDAPAPVPAVPPVPPIRPAIETLVEPPEEAPPATTSRVAAFADTCLDHVGDLSALEWYVLETLAQATGARRASLLTAHGRRPLLCGRAAIGPGEASVKTWRVPLGHGLAGRVAERDRPLVGRGETGGLRCYEGQVYVLLPLGRDPRSLGVIDLTDFESDTLPSDATLTHWMELAARAGRALAVARRVADAEENATLDSLTRLPNKLAYTHAIERELSRAARHGDRLGLAVLDLDHFRRVNNRYGHDAGDQVLQEFALRLQPAFRTTDMVARWGGEEFVVILPSLSPEPGPDDILPLERARQLVAGRPFRLPGGQGTLAVTFSAGVAVYPQHGTTAKDLFKAADKALYRAKKRGRNRTELAD